MTKTQFIELPWHKIARQMLECHRLIMLVGEPGNGKTTWAMQVGEQFNETEAMVLQGTPDTEINHIWGFFSLAGGKTVFCDGPLLWLLRVMVR